MDKDKTRKIDLSDINKELDINNTIKINTDDINNELYDNDYFDDEEYLDDPEFDEYDPEFENDYIGIDDYDFEEEEPEIDPEKFKDPSKLTIGDFEEIDNYNNSTRLENYNIDYRTDFEKKGYVRKPEPTTKPKTIKRKSTRDINLEDEGKTTNFYIMTLVAAGLICLLVFFIVFKIAFSEPRNSNDKDVNNLETEKNTEELILEDFGNYATSTGVIENIAKSGSIQIYDFYDQTSVSVKYVSETELRDKYDKPLVIEEFKVGDIVDYSCVKDETELTSMSISSDSFEQNNMSKGINDPTSQTITYGDNTYKYNDKTIVSFERGTYAIEDIGEYDTVNITGFDDTIYYMEVLKGHGQVKFIQNPDIKNGIVEVDTTATYKAEELTTITLSEGAHKIVVKGDNITPYAADILVKANETTEFSLLVTDTKEGLLIPNVSPSDYTMKIDGEYVNSSKPIMLDYGAHTVNISKNGYDTYQDTINISSPETRLTVTLNQKVLEGKVTITTEPSGASIYVDNAYIGVSPITEPIQYGSHTITIKMDGYKEMPYPLEITKDNNSFYFTLQKADPVAPAATTEPTE